MKMAVIGAGQIGSLRARAIYQHPETVLIAVCDPDEAAAVATADATGAQAAEDYRAVLADSQIQAVVIATPVQLHEPMIAAAFRAGKHVLVEKPMSTSLESCARILDSWRVSGRALAVGFNHRFYPSVKFLRDVLDGGRIGELDHVRVYGGHDGLGNLPHEWMYRGSLSGGGAMMDVGIHMTDLARYVAGEIVEVYGVCRGSIWRVEGSEDWAGAILRTESGIPIHYEASWDQWKGYHWYVEVYGGRGMCKAYYAPMQNVLVTQDEPGGKRKKRYKLYPELIVKEKVKGWQSTTLATFVDEIDEFVRMCRGEEVLLANGFDGWAAVEVAQAVYRSAREGAPVRLTGAPQPVGSL